MAVGLDFKAGKEGFFDRSKVLRSLDRATARALSKFGASVRKAAQKSIVMREGPSSPGSPPHGHTSGKVTRVSKSTGKARVRRVSLLREFLFFSYDPSRKSVVIGPVRLGDTVNPRALPALEYGGPSTAEDPRTGRRRGVRVRARPFMGPAFERELPGLAPLFKNSLK